MHTWETNIIWKFKTIALVREKRGDGLILHSLSLAHQYKMLVLAHAYCMRVGNEVSPFDLGYPTACELLRIFQYDIVQSQHFVDSPAYYCGCIPIRLAWLKSDNADCVNAARRHLDEIAQYLVGEILAHQVTAVTKVEYAYLLADLPMGTKCLQMLIHQGSFTSDDSYWHAVMILASQLMSRGYDVRDLAPELQARLWMVQVIHANSPLVPLREHLRSIHDKILQPSVSEHADRERYGAILNCILTYLKGDFPKAHRERLLGNLDEIVQRWLALYPDKARLEIFLQDLSSFISGRGEK